MCIQRLIYCFRYNCVFFDRFPVFSKPTNKRITLSYGRRQYIIGIIKKNYRE